jgi:threo-3-hydroxy-L-aspartate ammonia-lyase
MLTYADIESAHDRIRGVAHRTPVVTSRQFDAFAGCSVFFKCENLQRGGAFKFRGAYNKLASLDEEERRRGVIAYSSGNHAQAVALAARLFGCHAVVVMPHDAPATKVAATRSYGAEIIFYDRQKQARDELAEAVQRERGLTLVPPYDDEQIMAGQATAAVELMEEVQDLDCLLASCSGCGLIAGCSVAARHLRPSIQIFGVEPESANDTWLSLKKGERVSIPVPETVADGLRVTSPGALTFPIVQQHVQEILLVSENEMKESIRFMLERMKLLVEPSGVAPAAAVRYRKHDFSGKRVGVILSGGNIDLKQLASFIQA